MGDLPQLLTIGEAARRLGIPTSTLRGWADRGVVRVVRTPTGHRRFDPTEIERLRQAMRHDTRNATTEEA